ncbi:decarboxylase [Streptomyces sp. NPDC100445]|uniref:maleate cis-trans isomerase family protein n=1 Tax=Streptomyces sp. NPDC100445 TaxID=3366102 RepID=UPI0038090F77
MTALGLLTPGHSAEDDYPRIEQLLGSDVRLDLAHTGTGGDALPLDAPDAAERLTDGMAALRLAGAEAVVWASTSGSFGQGWDGAQAQVRTLARLAGMPASSTSFAFVHAAREIGVRRVAVGATYPEEVAARFAAFLGDGGLEVTGVRSSAAVTAGRAATWDEEDLLTLARAADTADAEAVVLPDTALHTAAHLPLLEKALSKPVLTANQVTVWEGLRLVDRRVNAPSLGTLFTREPRVQA